jgi:hypothetical protein
LLESGQIHRTAGFHFSDHHATPNLEAFEIFRCMGLDTDPGQRMLTALVLAQPARLGDGLCNSPMVICISCVSLSLRMETVTTVPERYQPPCCAGE